MIVPTYPLDDDALQADTASSCAIAAAVWFTHLHSRLSVSLSVIRPAA